MNLFHLVLATYRIRPEDIDLISNTTRLPQELLLAIGQTPTPNEKIHLVLATYRIRPEEIDLITHLQYSAPTLSSTRMFRDLNHHERASRAPSGDRPDSNTK